MLFPELLTPKEIKAVFGLNIQHLARPKPKRDHARVLVREVAERVSAECDIPLREIFSESRKAEVARARQVVAWLSHKLTPYTLSRIARCLDRDHTTIIHSINKIDSLRIDYPVIRERTDALLEELRNRV